MELLQTIVALTSLVVISNILSHFLKRVPVSLIQIALGLLAALFFNLHVELETEWFLLLFIAPLLYSDAWRLYYNNFRRIYHLCVGTGAAIAGCFGHRRHLITN